MDVERSFSPSNIKFANCQAPFSHEMLLHMIYFFFFLLPYRITGKSAMNK